MEARVEAPVKAPVKAPAEALRARGPGVTRFSADPLSSHRGGLAHFGPPLWLARWPAPLLRPRGPALAVLVVVLAALAALAVLVVLVLLVVLVVVSAGGASSSS